MNINRTIRFLRRGIVAKAILVPVAIVVGLGLYVVVAGSTGFCPTCVVVLDAVRGRDGNAVAIANRGVPEKGISSGSIKGLVFTDLEGRSVPLSRWVGRPIVLDVWATWCAPCRKARADLHKIAEQVAEHGTLLSVSVDRGGAAVVKEYINTKEGGHTPFTELLATDPSFSAVLKPFESQPTIPKIVYIDADGNIVDIEYDASDPAWVLGRMRALGASGTKG
jgi:thiol-disulfide isomerase/thioredoxin